MTHPADAASGSDAWWTAAEAAADADLAAGRVTEFATMDELLADLQGATAFGGREVTLEYAGRAPLIPRADPDTADD